MSNVSQESDGLTTLSPVRRGDDDVFSSEVDQNLSPGEASTADEEDPHLRAPSQQNELTIAGGEFRNANIGTQNYNLSRSDIINASGANIHVQQLNVAQMTSSTPVQQQESGVNQEEISDTIKLSVSIQMFRQQKLSSSFTSRIYRGVKNTNVIHDCPLAIKVLAYDENNLKEAKTLLKLTPHHNVVSIVDSDTFGTLRDIYIAMELCYKKNLYDHVIENKSNDVPFDAQLSISQAKQITVGLNFIHSKQIIHRDLKPHNVLLSLDKQTLKIADFGISKPMTSGRTMTNVTNARAGTDGYRAPETYNSNEISKHTDVFSLGLVYYFLFSYGLHPFGDDPDDWNSNIKKNCHRDLNHLLVLEPEKATDLLVWMLQFLPRRRPTTNNILEHTYFKMTPTTPRTIASTSTRPDRQISDYAKIMSRQKRERERNGRGRLDQAGGQQQLQHMPEQRSAFTSFRPTASAQQTGEAVGTSSYGTMSANIGGARRKTIMSTGTQHSTQPRNTTMLPPLSSSSHHSFLSVSDPVSMIGGSDVNAIIVFDQKSSSLKCREIAEKRWETMQTMPQDIIKQRFTALRVANNIYVLLWNKFVYQLNYVNRNATWLRKDKMKFDHGWQPPADSMNGLIFVFGASGSSKLGCRDVEKFDAFHGTWKKMESMTISRTDHSVIAAGNFLYVVGGYNYEALAVVEKFHPNNESWSAVTSMNQPRFNSATAELQGRIYVLGGEYCSSGMSQSRKLSSVEYLDLHTEQWTSLTRQMTVPRSKFRVCSVQGKLYAIGGNKKGFHGEADVEVFDPATKNWRKFEIWRDMTIDCSTPVAVKMRYRLLSGY